jgi:hypothetical protein
MEWGRGKAKKRDAREKPTDKQKGMLTYLFILLLVGTRDAPIQSGILDISSKGVKRLLWADGWCPRRLREYWSRSPKLCLWAQATGS